MFFVIPLTEFVRGLLHVGVAVGAFEILRLAQTIDDFDLNLLRKECNLTLIENQYLDLR